MLLRAEDVVLNTVDGDLPVTKYEIPSGRLTKFIERVTKGLLAHYYPAYSHSEARFEVRHIYPTVDNLAKLERVRDLLKYDSRGSGVFQFRHGLTASGKSGVWILVFYEALVFLVSHTQNDFGRNSS